MMKEKEDHFKDKSKSWDMNSNIVNNAQAIAGLIVKNIKLDRSMHIMDFGAGTGLLSYCVAPYVAKVTAVDNSPAMLLEFQNKCDDFVCETEILEKDLSIESIDIKFDGIISSMTIHHLEDISALFTKFNAMLKDGGFIAIADLDSEDGSFHSDNTGVHHFGFDREALEKIAGESGFKEIRFDLASTIHKPHQKFTVFLLTAVKA